MVQGWGNMCVEVALMAFPGHIRLIREVLDLETDRDHPINLWHDNFAHQCKFIRVWPLWSPNRM